MSDATGQDATQRQVVFLAGPVDLPPGAIQLHAKGAETLKKPLQLVAEQWNDVMNQVAGLVKSADGAASDGPFALSEIEVGLAFSAEGQLAFIAKAGVEATVKVVFKRK